MKGQNTEYLAGIDHLRGIAALMVVFFHGVGRVALRSAKETGAETSGWLQGENLLQQILLEGHSAVALFMMLSGFIFTIGCYQHRLRYSGFIRNRLLRTYPLMLALIALALAIYPERFSLEGLLRTLFFLANTDGALTIKPFTGLFWAVAIEWQFYLIFPLLLLATNRWGWRFIVILIGCALLLRLAASQADINMVQLCYYSLLGRIDQFLLGMLAAIYFLTRFRAGPVHDVLFLLALIAAATMLSASNSHVLFFYNGPFRFAFPTIEGLVWACFAIGYLSVARWLPALLSRLLSEIGKISYSIYLLHSIVISLLLNWTGYVQFEGVSPITNGILNTALIVVPIVLIISTASYHAIEKPFLRLRVAYRDR